MTTRCLISLALLVAFSAAHASAQPSVIVLNGSVATGVGFAVASGDVIATSERLGETVSCDGSPAQRLISRRLRGIALWKSGQTHPVAKLADDVALLRETGLVFLTPETVPVETITATADSTRWQLNVDVWLTETKAAVPPGAPLVRPSDGTVVGLAVASEGLETAVVSADSIRLTCFDAGVSLNQTSTPLASARIVASWPYGGSTDTEFSHAEADRLEAWRDIAGLLPTYQSSLIAADGSLYFGDRRGRVYCVDTVRRTLVWSQTLDAPIIFPPVVDEDRVYVPVFALLLEVRDESVLWRERHWYASGVGYLYAMDRRTGEIKWRHVSGLRGSPLLAADRVYLGGLNGYGALSAYSGRSLWLQGEYLGKHETPNWYVTGPEMGDTVSVLALQMRLYEKEPRRTLRIHGDTELRLVDKASGNTRRSIRLGQVLESDHPFATAFRVSPKGDAIVIATGKVARAYGLPDGRLMWERSLRGRVVPGSVFDDEYAYLPLDEPSITCLSISTGAVKWRFTGLKGAPGALLLKDSRLYLGALDGRLYGLSAAMGSLEWDLECPGGRVSGAPAMVGELLYFAASDGRIYAVANAVPVAGVSGN
jgi:outer membrane protein assembly factor BamB